VFVTHLGNGGPVIQQREVLDLVAGKTNVIDDSFGLHQLESFVCYLQDTKQTNVLNRFNDFSNAWIVSPDKQASRRRGVQASCRQWSLRPEPE
jgi:hypothetical protein